MNVDYIGGVTPVNSSSDSIVQFSFRIADCNEMRGGALGRHHVFRFLLLFP